MNKPKVGSVAWLRTVLDKLNNENAQIFIDVSGVMFPLCGKVTRSILTYETRTAPGIEKGEEVLTLHPCECSDEATDKKKGDNLFLN